MSLDSFKTFIEEKDARLKSAGVAGYNKAKNSKDNIDAKIVEEVSEDSPEEILAS